jgi:hypothetical protein
MVKDAAVLRPFRRVLFLFFLLPLWSLSLKPQPELVVHTFPVAINVDLEHPIAWEISEWQ